MANNGRQQVQYTSHVDYAAGPVSYESRGYMQTGCNRLSDYGVGQQQDSHSQDFHPSHCLNGSHEYECTENRFSNTADHGR